MGHQRLGVLPRSAAWQAVVGLIADGSDVEEVAAATARAAEASMIDASQDPVVQFTFWLITRLPLAAREDDFDEALKKLGLNVVNDPTLVDVISGVMDLVDDRARGAGSRTDFGEIAQLSAAETLSAVVGREMSDLFGTPPDATKTALAGFATVKQFAVLARDYFARLTRAHLSYYLSRELAKHVGPGRRFASVREHRAFEEALELHCRQATLIIHSYSGEWLSKQNFEGGIDLGKAGRFVRYASKKLRDELLHRRKARVA